MDLSNESDLVADQESPEEGVEKGMVFAVPEVQYADRVVTGVFGRCEDVEEAQEHS